ncbi:cold shock domain-containing protein [Pelagibacteraceae bacterium]|nr:cold shock domain-containing protein [Pelagibacteraceae bacterium]
MSSTVETIKNGVIGKVKWFNNKAGYGFITVSEDGDYNGKDIFTHYTAVKVTNSQYKYLVQGEYVEFELVKPESGSHEYKAMSVTGISGGELMCETRNVTRKAGESDEFTTVRKNKRKTKNTQSTDA